MPKDSVEIVLQLLRAVTAVCVCCVEEPGTAALRVLTWELLSLQSTELKAQSLSVPWCYFLFFLSLWQDSQDRENHLPWKVPVVACGTGGERTAVCWVAQESSSELRKETPMSSLSGHMSTASPGNVNSAALSPPFARAVGEPALTVQPCRCCWAWTNGHVGYFSKGIEMSAQLQDLIWVMPQGSGRAGCTRVSVPSAQGDTQGITESPSSPKVSGLCCTLFILIITG